MARTSPSRRIVPVHAYGLGYTDADVFLSSFEVAKGVPHGNQPLTPAYRDRS